MHGRPRPARRAFIKTMAHQVVLVPGDGIGPEVVEAARRAVEATGAEIGWVVRQAGQSAREQDGSPLPPETVMAIRDARVALKGPTLSGGPGPGPPSANVELRRALDLQLGVRPARSLSGAGGARPGIDLVLASMIQEDLYAGVDLAAGSDQARALRELVLAGSELEAGSEAGMSIKFMTRLGAEQIARAGLEWARDAGRLRVTVVHRADELPATDGLFLSAAQAMARDFSSVTVDDLTVDAALQELERRPGLLDVLLVPPGYTTLLEGVIAPLVGGVGMLPRASLGPDAAVFDTVHGSAAAHAGRGTANPIAQVLAGALLLRHLGEHERADRLEASVERVVAEGAVLPRDVAAGSPPASTEEVGDAIVAGLAEEGRAATLGA
jgi:isocitrate dehydrogenase (NAD+)